LLQNLLENHREGDLVRMYSLLSNIPNGLEALRNKFEAHVKGAGLAAIEKVAAEGDKSIHEDALREVYTQYQDLINDNFKADKEFLRSLDNACEKVRQLKQLK